MHNTQFWHASEYINIMKKVRREIEREIEGMGLFVPTTPYKLSLFSLRPFTGED